jgi:hypothetical protein
MPYQYNLHARENLLFKFVRSPCFYCRVQGIRNKGVVEDSNVVKFSKIRRNHLQFQKAKHTYCMVNIHEFLPH